MIPNPISSRPTKAVLDVENSSLMKQPQPVIVAHRTPLMLHMSKRQKSNPITDILFTCFLLCPFAGRAITVAYLDLLRI